MGWTDRIIFFSAGYIIGTSGYQPPGPLIHWNPSELRVLGYQVAVIEDGKVRIGNIDVLEVKK